MSDVALLVVDECHHTVGNHSYAKIMEQHYHRVDNKRNCDLKLNFNAGQESRTSYSENIGPICQSSIASSEGILSVSNISQFQPPSPAVGPVSQWKGSIGADPRRWSWDCGRALPGQVRQLCQWRGGHRASWKRPFNQCWSFEASRRSSKATSIDQNECRDCDQCRRVRTTFQLLVSWYRKINPWIKHILVLCLLILSIDFPKKVWCKQQADLFG